MQGCIQSGPVDLDKALDLSNLNDKVILITGGASGFGAAVAQKAAANGANIIIGDVNETLGTEMVANLRRTTGREHHHFVHCDVTSWSSQAAFFKQAATLSPHGGIDVVIANAGIADAGEGNRFEEPPDYSQMDDPADPRISRVIGINLQGVFNTTHLALSYLPRNPGSVPCSPDRTKHPRDRQIILVSSMAGITYLPGAASYAAAKHGVVGLFRSLRVTAPQVHGVRINMINPYFVATPLIAGPGEVLLAGAKLAKLEDVVDVMIRFITDQGIVGRGLVVSGEGTGNDAAVVGLPHNGPVWDVYADDFTQTDTFVRRIVAITNLQVKLRGWCGVISDLARVIAEPVIRKLRG